MDWTFLSAHNCISFNLFNCNLFNFNLFNCAVMYKMWMDLDKCVYHISTILRKNSGNSQVIVHYSDPLYHNVNKLTFRYRIHKANVVAVVKVVVVVVVVVVLKNGQHLFVTWFFGS